MNNNPNATRDVEEGEVVAGDAVDDDTRDVTGLVDDDKPKYYF